MNVHCFVIFYNHENFVEQRLNNITQIFPHKNITIIDDFSTDHTLIKVKEFLFKNKIQSNLIDNSNNKGIFENWKYCAENATEEAIWILEGDDLTDQNFINRFKKIISHNDLDIFSGVTYSLNNKNQIIGNQTKKIFKKLKVDFLTKEEVTDFSKLNFILSILNLFPNIGSFIFKKNILKEILGNIEIKKNSISYAFDWILYFLLSQKKNLKFYFDFKAINFFKIHGNNFSEQKDKIKKVQEIKLVYDFIDKYNHNYSTKNLTELRNKYLETIQ